MLPPKSVWMEAPMLATTLRERTVIPRTTPRLAAIRYPSKVNAVVTHWRGMGMWPRSVRRRLEYGHELSSGDSRERRGTAHLALHQGAIILPAPHVPPVREGNAGRCRGAPPPRHEGAAARGLRRSDGTRGRDPAPVRPAGPAHPHGRPPPRRLSLRRARLRGQAPLRDVASLAEARRRPPAGRRRLRAPPLLRHGECLRGGRGGCPPPRGCSPPPPPPRPR